MSLTLLLTFMAGTCFGFTIAACLCAAGRQGP